MKVVAILQARMSSSRLPGKVLKPILGQPMIVHQLKRLQRCKRIDTLVVATSDQADDKPLAKLCQKHNIDCYTGSLTNVLDRFYQAALLHQADLIVRLTGDCPLADAQIIDDVIEMHISAGNDYSSNVEPPSFPDGFDVEVFSMDCLRQAWQQATLSSDLEHVTPYIRNTLATKKGNYESPTDYSHYRLTVDEPNDFELVEKIYQKLGQANQYFDSERIYQLLEAQPDLALINDDIARNEGYLTSLAKNKPVSPSDL